MTNDSSDSVRVAHPLFQAESGGSIPTSALQLLFGETDRKTFEQLNALWHSRLPKIGGSFGRIYYVAEYDGLYYATAMWSNPVARLLPQHTWLELRRFAIACDAPKYTASRMLGWMIRNIKRKFPLVVRLISYQECDYHTGTIYRSANWTPAVQYISRPRDWARWRKNRTGQKIGSRIRWEYKIGEANGSVQHATD